MSIRLEDFRRLFYSLDDFTLRYKGRTVLLEDLDKLPPEIYYDIIVTSIHHDGAHVHIIYLEDGR